MGVSIYYCSYFVLSGICGPFLSLSFTTRCSNNRLKNLSYFSSVVYFYGKGTSNTTLFEEIYRVLPYWQRYFEYLFFTTPSLLKVRSLTIALQACPILIYSLLYL